LIGSLIVQCARGNDGKRVATLDNDILGTWLGDLRVQRTGQGRNEADGREKQRGKSTLMPFEAGVWLIGKSLHARVTLLTQSWFQGISNSWYELK
jgi:hypothetical protein